MRLQFKSFSRKADVNAYLDKLRRDAANEPDAAVRKRHMSYIRFVKRPWLSRCLLAAVFS